jgi:hypothetical protein
VKRDSSPEQEEPPIHSLSTVNEGSDGLPSDVMKLLLRPITASSFVQPLRPLLVQRNYATHHDLGKNSTNSRRRAVTPFNDDGFVPWSELSAAEKASRATQQSFNFGLVVVGVVLTVGQAFQSQSLQRSILSQAVLS